MRIKNGQHQISSYRTFEENSYDNIAAAFAGINSVFAKLHNEISGNIEKNALLWSNGAGAFVARHGKDEKKAITILLMHLMQVVALIRIRRRVRLSM